MVVPCRFFANQTRLINALQSLSTKPSFRYFTLQGLIIKTRNHFNVVSSTVTLIIIYVDQTQGKTILNLFTSNPELATYNNKYLDTDIVKHDSIYFNLCQLIKERYKIIQGSVTIEFKGQGNTTAISISPETENELQCIMRGERGEVSVAGANNIASVLSDCTSIQSFSYNITSQEYQKQVSIKHGRIQILMEIAKYLNRTIVFVSFLPDGSGMLEQYISATATLEILTKHNGVRIYRRVPNNKLRELDAFCIYQSSTSIERLMREQGRALSQRNTTDPSNPNNPSNTETHSPVGYYTNQDGSHPMYPPHNISPSKDGELQC